VNFRFLEYRSAKSPNGNSIPYPKLRFFIPILRKFSSSGDLSALCEKAEAKEKRRMKNKIFLHMKLNLDLNTNDKGGHYELNRERIKLDIV
tara:strand:+ start:51 stop:323 length:273 start_codon:yes stop_codon:yes gene_type:complete